LTSAERWLLPRRERKTEPAFEITPKLSNIMAVAFQSRQNSVRREMAKIAKTADRKKVMDTSKSTDCPKCGKPTRIVKRVKDRERGVPGGIFISCSACEFYEKL
jgi:DNA-directed RNA polymerase subunit M/transcription elongation factor TFIIS